MIYSCAVPLDRPLIHLVGGTRPEAIKLAPLAMAMRSTGRLRPWFVASGQHPLMFREGLASFGLTPDEFLPCPRLKGTQAELVSRLSESLDASVAADPPDAVVVQGDTTTALVAAMVAFWRGIPVVHLEAGLRSGDLRAPFPEEANRRMIAQIASLHLAPTDDAALRLITEGVTAASVVTTGNTVVDAARHIAARPATDDGDPDVSRLVARARDAKSRLVLVTVHRRESWGQPVDNVMTAIERLLQANPDIAVLWPVHPNPALREQVYARLLGTARVVLTDPLGYSDLIRALAASTLVLTDSGGVQEEAPSFGVPVLVLRDTTERVEAIEAGCALLVGTETENVVAAADRLLSDESALAAMSAVRNPFGDGRAAARAETAIAALLARRSVRARTAGQVDEVALR